MERKYPTTITASSGGTYAITKIFQQSYVLRSTSINYAAGSFTITIDGTYTPLLGDKIDILYIGTGNTNYLAAGTITVIGTVLPLEFVNKSILIECIYDGAAWQTVMSPDLSSTSIISGTSITNETIPLIKLNLSGAAADIIVADAGKVPAYVAMTGDITISNTGVTAIGATKVTTAMMNPLAITKAQIADNSVDNGKLDTMAFSSIKIGGPAGDPADLAIGSAEFPLGNGATVNSIAMSGLVGMDNTGTTTISLGGILVSHVENALKTEMLVFPVSFETGEQCNNRIKIPFACTVIGMYAVAKKAIAATDNGTITLKNAAATSMTNGLITFTASDALETAYSVTPSANNVVVANDIIYVVTAKATAGGKALVSLTLLRS